jgi:hypothetical protein
MDLYFGELARALAWDRENLCGANSGWVASSTGETAETANVAATIMVSSTPTRGRLARRRCAEHGHCAQARRGGVSKSGKDSIT